MYWIDGCMILGMSAPAKYKDPKDMQIMIDLWVTECQANGTPLTVVGLARGLGFCDKNALYDYQKKDLFTTTIKNARAMVEQNTLERAIKSNGAGAIFYLKNLGYTDKQIVQIDPITLIIKGKDALL